MPKPNHICKYSKCKLGTDENGDSCHKKYYSCDDCGRYPEFLKIGCCLEHALAYKREVLIARNEWSEQDEENFVKHVLPYLNEVDGVKADNIKIEETIKPKVRSNKRTNKNQLK